MLRWSIGLTKLIRSQTLRLTSRFRRRRCRAGVLGVAGAAVVARWRREPAAGGARQYEQANPQLGNHRPRGRHAGVQPKADFCFDETIGRPGGRWQLRDPGLRLQLRRHGLQPAGAQPDGAELRPGGLRCDDRHRPLQHRDGPAGHGLGSPRLRRRVRPSRTSRAQPRSTPVAAARCVRRPRTASRPVRTCCRQRPSRAATARSGGRSTQHSTQALPLPRTCATTPAWVSTPATPTTKSRSAARRVSGHSAAERGRCRLHGLCGLRSRSRTRMRLRLVSSLATAQWGRCRALTTPTTIAAARPAAGLT